MNKKVLAIIAISILLNSTGQVFFKMVRDAWPNEPVVSLFFHPETWAAVFVYGMSAMCWLWVLSRAPLSLAYPMLAFAFPIVVGLSAVLFSETIFFTRLVGVGVIGIGVSLLART